MICRYHNHQKTLNLKYIPVAETILVSDESSLFSILKRNGIKILRILIRRGVYHLRLRFPNGMTCEFTSDKLQSDDLITRIISTLNEIKITPNRRQFSREATGLQTSENPVKTSTELPVFYFKPGA
ncbi:MAG: hypothetical protein LCH52_05570 [Bacteroidetes bacterium]|nr:hypothetical protein [Bacteroidota bacterium]